MSQIPMITFWSLMPSMATVNTKLEDKDPAARQVPGIEDTQPVVQENLHSLALRFAPAQCTQKKKAREKETGGFRVGAPEKAATERRKLGTAVNTSCYGKAEEETLPQQKGVKSGHLKKECSSRTPKCWEG